MDRLSLRAMVERTVAPRRLLDHEFYRRWTRGELSVDELRAYAAQYRHFEAHLPAILGAAADRAGNPALRAAALRNLADEAGGSVTHLELFDRFVDGLGGGAAEASPATARLLETYDRQVETSAGAALAGVLAYEWQAAEVAREKADGLREHHGIEGESAEFWTVHAEVDGDHAAWLLDALAASGESAELLEGATREACDAWLGFLDERQAEAPAVLSR